MAQFQVVVSNIGTVYAGNKGNEALKAFLAYRSLCMAQHGRAAGESVTMLRDGEISREHVGTLAQTEG